MSSLGFDLRITDRSTCTGVIKLGDFEETVRIGTDVPLEWYEAQWQHSLARLVTTRVAAIVVVSVPARASSYPPVRGTELGAPDDEWIPILGVGWAWTFEVDDDDLVHVHNVLLFPELTVIDGFDVLRLTPDDEEGADDDDARPISEWTVALSDVAAFLER